MSKTIKVIYDAASLKTTITIEGQQFDTSRIDGKEIADWAYPFMLRKVKWGGFYEEMVSALGGEKEFNLLFEGAEEDLNELKEAWEDAPVTIISEETTGNIAVITYDECTLSTTITVNGETFDTSRINGREIGDWVYPFMMRKVKWDGIFEELTKAFGSEEYTIQFSGSEAALKELIEECPEIITIQIQNPSLAVSTGVEESVDSDLEEERAISDDEDESLEETVTTVTHPSSTHNEEAESEYKKGMDYYNGDHLPKDYAKAFLHFQNAEAKGLPEAKNMIGECYYYGHGVERNYAAAFIYFSEAAVHDLSNAQYSLGYCYEFGQGVSKNYALALKWYQKAAEQNYASAQRNLGLLYLNGSGVAINQKKAFELFKLAAEQDNNYAQVLLGDCYANGTGTIQNEPMAYYWYSKAAELNSDAKRKKEKIEKNDPLCILRIPLDETPAEPELLRWVSDSNLMYMTIKGKSVFAHFEDMLSKLLKCSKSHREGHYRDLNGILDMFVETTLWDSIEYSEQPAHNNQWKNLYPKLSVIDRDMIGFNKIINDYHILESCGLGNSSKFITPKENMPIFLVCYLQYELKKITVGKGYDSWHTCCNDYITRLETLKSDMVDEPSASIRNLQVLFQNMIFDGSFNEEDHMYITLVDVAFSNYIDEIQAQYDSLTNEAETTRKKFGLFGRLVGPSDGEINETVKSRILEMAFKLYLFFICKCFIISESDKMCDDDDTRCDDDFFDKI